MDFAAYLPLARPLDWLKNAFVPLGLLFAEAWDRGALIVDVTLVTVAFCLAASAVYAFNDVSDADTDRRHKLKRQRPVASVPSPAQPAPRQALAFAFVPALAALAIAAAVRPEALAIIGCYLILNLFYSRLLRRIAFIDVATIAAGFMLRVLAGTVGVGIPSSGWLLATSLALTLFLGFAKRRAESVSRDSGGSVRPSLAAYNPRLLDALTLLCAVLTGLLYTGFTLDRRSIEGHAAPLLWLTALPALGMLARYAWLVFNREQGENPVRDLLEDPPILFLGFLWLAITVLVIGGFF